MQVESDRVQTQVHHRHTHGPLLPRQPAPKFTNVTTVLANNKFKKISLDDYKGTHHL
jgi:hypothetical protein